VRGAGRLIDVPSTVSCPDTIDLDYTASDYDDDIESARWLVDGVRMATSVTTLDFRDGHDLTAIVRDERGATDGRVRERRVEQLGLAIPLVEPRPHPRLEQRSAQPLDDGFVAPIVADEDVVGRGPVHGRPMLPGP
jgi:hypothetical protein